MSRTTRPQASTEAAGSPLDSLPGPDEIRERMFRNAAENRVLRSLYRIARRIEEQKRQEAARQPSEVAHAG